ITFGCPWSLTPHFFTSTLRRPILAAAMALAASVVGAQGPTMTSEVTVGHAVRAERLPSVDGRDDEAIWDGARALENFRQSQPAEDGEPSFRTSARMSYDERTLYVF